MISEDLKKDIDSFINRTGEPYKMAEKVPFYEIDNIYNRYMRDILNLSNEQRREILKILESSWKANSAHGNIRQWLRLCVGMAKLLKIEESDYINKAEAVDIIVRVSRWYRSSHFYEQFVPFAQKIVSTIWGSIDNLYYNIEDKRENNKIW